MTRGKIIVGIIIVLVLAVGIYALQLLNQTDRVEISEDDEDLGISNGEDEDNEIEREGVLNILLFGIDEEYEEVSGENRSDAIIIASLDWDNESIKLISLLRDTRVEIPGYGMDKLNHAYAYGGPELSIRTINENFDMNIRDFVSVDFQGFQEIVDSIDGVEIDIREVEARHMGLESSGLQRLDGARALEYSRIRKIGNDYERTERQRNVLEAAFKEIMNIRVTRYPRLLQAALPYVETSLSNSKVLNLAREVSGSDMEDIEQLRLPADEYLVEDTINGVSYVVPWELEDNVRLLQEFIYGE